MKNWFKTFELEERDVLITKCYEDENGDEAFTVDFKFYIEGGIIVTQSVGFENEEKMDQAFDRADEFNVQNIVDSVLKLAGN